MDIPTSCIFRFHGYSDIMDILREHVFPGKLDFPESNLFEAFSNFTFEVLVLQVPGEHFLIFEVHIQTLCFNQSWTKLTANSLWVPCTHLYHLRLISIGVHLFSETGSFITDSDINISRWLGKFILQCLLNLSAWPCQGPTKQHFAILYFGLCHFALFLTGR